MLEVNEVNVIVIQKVIQETHLTKWDKLSKLFAVEEYAAFFLLHRLGNRLLH